MSYKPDGYNDVSVYLLVADAEEALTFMHAAFDAPRLRVIHRDNGSIMHAEARIGDTVVMMGESPGGPPANVHVYLPDVDAAMARALAAGGREVQPVIEKGDGDRRGGVTAPDGTTWWLSTQVGVN